MIINFRQKAPLISNITYYTTFQLCPYQSIIPHQAVVRQSSRPRQRIAVQVDPSPVCDTTAELKEPRGSCFQRIIWMEQHRKHVLRSAPETQTVKVGVLLVSLANLHLHLLLRIRGGSMQIFVKTLTNRTIACRQRLLTLSRLLR